LKIFQSLRKMLAEGGRGRRIEDFGRTHALVRVVGGFVESSVDELVEDQFERREEDFDGGLKRERD
jgi:hypothetical protein